MKNYLRHASGFLCFILLELASFAGPKNYQNAFASIFYRRQVLIEIADIKIMLKQIYVDLSAITEALFLDRNYTMANQRMQGYLDDPNQTFDVKLLDRNAKGHRMFIRDIRFRWFVSLDFINQHSNLNISGNTETLNILIAPDEILPFENYKRFTKDLEKDEKLSRDAEQEDFSNAPYQMLSYPKLQITNRSFDGTQTKFLNQTTINSEFDLFWAHTFCLSAVAIEIRRITFFV